MRLSTIPYITLWVHHFDECVRFYRDKLGLSVERHDPNFIQFATEGTRLYLHRSADVTPLRRDVLEIHFAVSDVDAAYQQLQSQGVAFECAPQNMPWGLRVAACRDPEGFIVELVGPHKPDEPVAIHAN